MTNIEEKAHAEYSASGSSRWLNCPASHELSKLAPKPPESKYALEGTEAHACLEFLMMNRDNLKKAKTQAKKKYTPEMVAHASFAVDWILERFKKTPVALLLCETKVDASPFTCEGQFGTLDAAIVDPFGRLVVIDYKYGAGIGVDPREGDGRLNSQLAYYALAISHEYDHNFSDVELVVIQPRAFHDSGETIRSAVATMDELLSWEKIFKAGVRATKDEKPALLSGKHCRFCPASVSCPELKDKSFREAQIAFSDISGVIEAPKPEVIPIPNLSTVLNACDRLEDWIEKVREHAHHVLEKGGSIPGFKLVEKRGTRKWVNQVKVENEAIELYGMVKAFTEPELLSPAQLEKSLKDVPGIQDWIEARVTVKSSGTTVARDSDKRPAVNGAELAFGPITDRVQTPKRLRK